MKAVIYARFSSSSQREESIERQVSLCEDFAERNKYEIVHIYEDRALTGKNDNRPSFKKLMKDSRENLFDVVLVSGLDRFARNLQQALEYEAKLLQNEVYLISVKEPFIEGPAGRLNRNIMLAYAQYYSDELSQKIREGIELNASKCMYHGGSIALGYKVGPDKRFEINHDTAPVVKRIFEMYANGKTVIEITTLLNEQGIKTSRGAMFNKNSLHAMLKNKQYLGIYTYKDTETPGGMPRIISDELFNKVAEVMKKNKRAPARKKAKVAYLLTTKLFCGHCGEMMTGFSGIGNMGKVYNYYICNGRKQKKCSKTMVHKNYIEDLVISECRKLLTDDNIKQIAKETVAVYKREKDQSNLNYLKKCLAQNERRHQNAIAGIMESDIESVRKALAEQIPILEKEHRELEKQIAIEEAPFPNVSTAKIRFFLNQLKKGNVCDIKYKKTLINIFVNKIYLWDDKITITYNTWDEHAVVDEKTLAEIEASIENEKNLFFNGSSPP